MTFRRISCYASDHILSLSSSRLSVFSAVSLSAGASVSRIMWLLNPATGGTNATQRSRPVDKGRFLQVGSVVFLRSVLWHRRCRLRHRLQLLASNPGVISGAAAGVLLSKRCCSACFVIKDNVKENWMWWAVVSMLFFSMKAFKIPPGVTACFRSVSLGKLNEKRSTHFL